MTTVLAFLAVLAGGLTAASTPDPVPAAVEYRVVAQTYKALNGAATSPLEFGAEVSVWGPLAFGDGAPLEVGVQLALTSQPAEVPGDPFDIALVRSAAATLYAGKRVGRYAPADVETRVVGLWGFNTATAPDTPGDRYKRRYGIGTLLTHRATGAEILTALGRDEAAGERGWGQWIIEGSFPLHRDGLAILGADVVLSVGRPQHVTQRDAFRVWLGTDLVGIAGKLRR